MVEYKWLFVLLSKEDQILFVYEVIKKKKKKKRREDVLICVPC